jgi:hypothetical protein
MMTTSANQEWKSHSLHRCFEAAVRLICRWGLLQEISTRVLRKWQSAKLPWTTSHVLIRRSSIFGLVLFGPASFFFRQVSDERRGSSFCLLKPSPCGGGPVTSQVPNRILYDVNPQLLLQLQNAKILHGSTCQNRCSVSTLNTMMEQVCLG